MTYTREQLEQANKWLKSVIDGNLSVALSLCCIGITNEQLVEAYLKEIGGKSK